MGNALLRALDDHARSTGVGEALASPAYVELVPGTIVQPDVFVLPSSSAAMGGTWQEVQALLLAVEVLSPSTARYDRVSKRRFYQRVGVPEYWIVDVDARLVERWRPDDERPEILTDRLAWRPDPARAALEIDLPPWFAEVVGE